MLDGIHVVSFFIEIQCWSTLFKTDCVLAESKQIFTINFQRHKIFRLFIDDGFTIPEWNELNSDIYFPNSNPSFIVLDYIPLSWIRKEFRRMRYWWVVLKIQSSWGLELCAFFNSLSKMKYWFSSALSFSNYYDWMKHSRRFELLIDSKCLKHHSLNFP